MCSGGTFSVLSELESLDLSHNSIMKIDDDTLAGMKVSHMNLGYNKLRQVPTLALQKMTNVDTSILNNNLFQSLETGAIHQIKGRPSCVQSFINNSVYLLSIFCSFLD